MNNLSDRNILIIILFTIFFIFGLIFSVKSPERRLNNSPLIWKSEYSETLNNNIIKLDRPFNNYYFMV